MFSDDPRFARCIKLAAKIYLLLYLAQFIINIPSYFRGYFPDFWQLIYSILNVWYFALTFAIVYIIDFIDEVHRDILAIKKRIKEDK